MNAHKHPAKAGRLWWKQGFQLLKQQPIALTSLVFFYFFIMLAFALIPIVGAWLSLVLVPGLSVGFYRACQLVETKQHVTPLVFLEAFFTQQRQAAKALLLLGIMYVVALLLACAVTVPFDDGQLFSALVLNQSTVSTTTIPNTWGLAELILALAYLPIQILFLFSPVLVAWHHINPIKALFFSLIACTRNLGALTVFSLSLFIASLLGAVLVTIIYVIFGANAQRVAVILLGAGLMAWFNCACYVTYMYIFQPLFPLPTQPTSSS